MQRQLQTIDRKNKDLTNGEFFFYLLIMAMTIDEVGCFSYQNSGRNLRSSALFQEKFSKNSDVMSSAVKILCWLEKADDRNSSGQKAANFAIFDAKLGFHEFSQSLTRVDNLKLELIFGYLG